MQISRDQVKQLIESTSNGKFFTVDFIKKDGSPRTMQARLGVTQYLATPITKEDNKDNRMSDTTFAHKDNLLGCYDVVTGGYRCINVDTMTRLAMNGKTYEVVA